jgi:prepilin-type N-terminal cleavage/methylation domain-containing protein
MSAGCRGRPPGAPDAGFTLVEVLVATMVIGTVMTALTTFFITSLSVTSQQRAKQTAIQLAADGIEQVRALGVSGIGVGRNSTRAKIEWDNAPSAVVPYLANTQLYVPDATESGAGSGGTVPAEALPSAPQQVTINKIDYRLVWYVGRCWQQLNSTLCQNRPADPVPFLRAVVAVSWPDRHCPAARCYYVASTLVGGAQPDPLFTVTAWSPSARAAWSPSAIDA